MGPNERGVEAVVEAVASVTAEAPLEMKPLYEAIDAETIDVLMARPRSNGSDVLVEFFFNGCQVVVDGAIVYVRKTDA